MNFKDLPSTLPLYGAEGIILLPRAQLPLVIMDSEGRAALDCALMEKHRLLGVVQVNPVGGHFRKGCVGRIVSFQEGARPFVLLQGICRFNVDEISTETPLKAEVSYEGYEMDLEHFS